MRYCSSPLELIVVAFVIGILSALLLPPTCGPRPRMRCANNLMQLYKLGTVYASTHKGEWPELAGDALWLSLAREHAEVLACPLRDEECGPGETHYFGPKVPWKKLALGDPVGGDKPGNHGEGHGGYVLFKDGRVEEIPGR